jgi:hypothetical protein
MAMRNLPGSLYLSRALCVLLVLILAACSSIGPKSLDRDQLDYGRSVGDNWKNQMLANLVRIRYVDMPVFVDVGQIVSGYSLETTVGADVGWGTSISGGDSQGLRAGGRYTDRPTITYMPKTGEDYLRSLLEPVEPRSLLSLVLAGYSSKLLFTWAVESINGMRNYSIRDQAAQRADPEFLEFVQTLHTLQKESAISFELINDPETGHDIILTFARSDLGAHIQALRQRIAELSGLNPDVNRYRVMYAPYAPGDDVLAIQTRSILQMLSAMSGFIDVPPEKASHAAPGYDLSGTADAPFRVLSGPDRPKDSFAAVEYKDAWYWIRNEDLQSKMVFTLMLFLTTLTNYAGDEQAPVLTIPTN